MANALILRGAGINCNNETEFALKMAGASTRQAHINELITGKQKLSDFDIFVIPGGFSYGDDLGAGKILANQIKHNLKDQIKAFVDDDKLIIGICNGFQVLVKTGLLPGNFNATLTSNVKEKFEDRWIYIKSASKNRFNKDISIMHVPVNHGEGRFIFEDIQKKQIAFQYCLQNGDLANDYPENPNGSTMAIAGVTNSKGNIIGLMPHPEKAILEHQHPDWTRIKPDTSAFTLFRNIVEHTTNKNKNRN